MKKNKKELNVDYIGGQGPMTVAEEKELSEYFNKQKLDLKQSKKKAKQKTDKRSKVNA